MKVDGFLANIVLVVAAVAVVMSAGCQRDADTTRELLRQRQAGWTRDIGVLTAGQAEIRSRFEGLPNAVDEAGAAAPAGRQQVTAILDGNRQSLVDLDIHLRQITGRVDEALARGGGETGMKVLDEESGQIGDSLQVMRDRLAATEHEIGALQRQTTSNPVLGTGATAAAIQAANSGRN